MRSDWLALGVGVLALGVGALGSLWPRPAPEQAWADAITSPRQLDLSPWLPDRSELVDPRTRLPRTHHFPASALREALAGRVTAQDIALLKLARWQRHQDGEPLPADFFDNPPFMHPMGRSYAALADRAEGRHVTENPVDELGRTSDATRLAWVHGQRDVVGSHWVITGTTWSAMSILPRALFDQRLDRDGYRWSDCATTSAVCLVPAHRTWAWRALLMGGVWSALSLATSVLLARRDRAAHAEEQAFMLRTLTHELRTPATAIGLHLDALRSDFDALPEAAQDAFLGLLAANQTLRTTLEATGTFLTVQRGTVRLDVQSVDLSDLQLGVPIHGEATLRTDPRWLMVALGNLVANADVHGRAPIEVQVQAQPEGVAITVQDAGDLSTDLDTLTQPFERGADSEGLGLGLALTQRIATLLGGRLTLRHHPTRFTLTVRDLP